MRTAVRFISAPVVQALCISMAQHLSIKPASRPKVLTATGQVLLQTSSSVNVKSDMPRAPPHRAHTTGRGKDGTGTKIAAGKDSIELQKWTGPGGANPKRGLWMEYPRRRRREKHDLGAIRGGKPLGGQSEAEISGRVHYEGTGGFSSFLVHPLVSPYFSLVNSIDSARGGGTLAGRENTASRGRVVRLCYLNQARLAGSGKGGRCRGESDWFHLRWADEEWMMDGRSGARLMCEQESSASSAAQ